MLRGAIRSGALEETNATWRAWLATSRKVILYQRHRLGGTAANNGVATLSSRRKFNDLAEGFALENRSSDGVEPGQGRGDAAILAVIEMNSVKENEINGSGFSRFVSAAIRTIRTLGVFAVNAVDLSGVGAAPTLLLCMLFLVVIGLQQRDLRRLKDQVEELVGTVKRAPGSYR